MPICERIFRDAETAFPIQWSAAGDGWQIVEVDVETGRPVQAVGMPFRCWGDAVAARTAICIDLARLR